MRSDAFPCNPAQKGLLVFIAGQPAGLDYVSLESAYAGLHAKLIRSYAMEAILKAARASNGIDEKARRFLSEIKESEEKRYKSKGHGWDHRLTGKAVVGSALVYRGAVIHMAFFRKDEQQSDTTRISSLCTRRNFRTG